MAKHPQLAGKLIGLDEDGILALLGPPLHVSWRTGDPENRRYIYRVLPPFCLMERSFVVDFRDGQVIGAELLDWM